MNSCSDSLIPVVPGKTGRTRKLAKPRKRLIEWHGSALPERHTTLTRDKPSSSSCSLTTRDQSETIQDLVPNLPGPQNASSGPANATQTAGVDQLAAEGKDLAVEKECTEKRADSNTARSCREQVQPPFKGDLADDIKTENVNEFTIEDWCDLGVGGSSQQPSPLPHGSPDSVEKIETVDSPVVEPCRQNNSTVCFDTPRLTPETTDKEDHIAGKLSGQPYLRIDEFSEKGTSLSDTVSDNANHLIDIKTVKTSDKKKIPKKKLKRKVANCENGSTGENIEQDKDKKQTSTSLYSRSEVDISNCNLQSPLCKPLPMNPILPSASSHYLQQGPQAPELPSLWSLSSRSSGESELTGNAGRCPAQPTVYPCVANLALVKLPHLALPRPTATSVQSSNTEDNNPENMKTTLRDSFVATEILRTDTGRPEPTTEITPDTTQPSLRTPSYGLGIASIRYPTNENGVPFPNVVYPSSFGVFHIDTSQSAGLVLMPSQPYFIQPFPLLPFLPAVVSSPVCTAQTQTDFQSVQAASERPCPSVCSAAKTTISVQSLNHSDQTQSHSPPVIEVNLPTATPYSSRVKERSKTRTTDFVDPTRLKFGLDDIGDDDPNHPGDCSDHSDQEWQPRSERFKIPMPFTSVDGKANEIVANDKVKKNRRQGKQPPPTCEVCGKVFKGTYYLRRHQLSHAEVRPYQCPQCQKSFRQKAHLIGHQNVHLRALQPNLDEIPSSSPKPKSPTAGVRCPGRPRKIYASQELSCKECGKTFKTVYRLKRHEMSHTDYRPFACRVCGKGFKQTGHRNEHEANHETKNKRRFLCNHCGVVFRCRSSFNNHRRLHAREHSDKPDLVTDLGLKEQQPEALTVVLTGYDCPYCAEKFATAQALNNHLDTHVEVQQRRHVQPYSCHVCKRSFTYRHNLLKHALMHKVPGKFAQFFKEKMEAHVASGKPSFKCSKCSKIFLRKETMVKHGKIHLDFKPFRCPTCCREFTQNVHLKVHMRKHTGSRPFQCTECQKSFIDSTALAKHVEYEACSSDNSLYHCKICDKLHYYIGSLKQHIRREHAIPEHEVPGYILRTEKASRRKQQSNSGRHVCKLCSSSFSEKCNLLRHVRRKHALQVELLQKELGAREADRVHVEKKKVDGNVDGEFDVGSKQYSENRLLSETSVTNEMAKTEGLRHGKERVFEMPHRQSVCGQENNQNLETDKIVGVEVSKGTSSKISSLLPSPLSRILSAPCNFQPVSFTSSPPKFKQHPPQKYQMNSLSPRHNADENRIISSSPITDNLIAPVDGVQTAKKTSENQDPLEERSRATCDWISQSNTCYQRPDRTSPCEQDLVSPVNDINFLYNIGLIVSRKASCCQDSSDADPADGHRNGSSKLLLSLNDELKYSAGKSDWSEGLVQEATIDEARVDDGNHSEDATPASHRPETANIASRIRAHNDLPCNMDYGSRPIDSNRGGDFSKLSNLILPQETVRFLFKTQPASDLTFTKFDFKPGNPQMGIVNHHRSHEDSGHAVFRGVTTSYYRPCVPNRDTVGKSADISAALLSFNKESPLRQGCSRGQCTDSNDGSVQADTVPLGLGTTGLVCCQVGRSDPHSEPHTHRGARVSSPERSGLNHQQSESVEVSEHKETESGPLEAHLSLPSPLAAESDCLGPVGVVQTAYALHTTETRTGCPTDARTVTHQDTRTDDEFDCQPHTKDAVALEDLPKTCRPWLEELMCCSRPKKGRQLNRNIRLRGEVAKHFHREDRASTQRRPKRCKLSVEFQQSRTVLPMTRPSPSNGLSREIHVDGIQPKHNIQQTDTTELKDKFQEPSVSSSDQTMMQTDSTAAPLNSLRLPPGSTLLPNTGTTGPQLTMNVSLNPAPTTEQKSSVVETCCVKKTGPDDRTCVRERNQTASPPFSSPSLVSEQPVAEGRQQFPCPACQKLFTARHQLKRHQMTHTDLRPHSCPECGRGFRQKIHMSDHVKRHKGQRPFLCTACGKRFILKNELNQHLKNHCKGRTLVPAPSLLGNPPFSGSDVSQLTKCLDQEPVCSLHLDPSFLLAFRHDDQILPDPQATRNPQINFAPTNGSHVQEDIYQSPSG